MGEEVEKVEPRPVAEYKWKARAQAAEAQVEAMRRKITVAHILCCGTAPKQAVGEVLASALDALSVPAEERGSSSAESAARRPADGCDQTLRAALEPFARFHEAMEHMGRSFPRSGEWYGLESSVTGERKLMVEDFARARAALASSTPESSSKPESAADIIHKIASISAAVGWQSGEPAMEMAGLIVSVLHANPEHIERFMAEGGELILDGTIRAENGSLTYRAISGEMLSPAELRRRKGIVDQ